jgi:MFS family permease
MQQELIRLPYLTLVLMISFASVNAVLFTPALPDIAHYFLITDAEAQLTLTLFLIGYALGQLLYGPIANRFGRKPAIYAGITLQIVSCLVCILAGIIHQYVLLVAGRFFLALGSGVGLKMTFTLINECYEPKIASQKIAYLLLAFAVTPGLAVAIGGSLNMHFGWTSCFYALAIYGSLLLMLAIRLPETSNRLDLQALKFNHLIHSYTSQFRNQTLLSGGLLMGICSTYVYVFATLAPFLAINLSGMSSSQYGLANLLPPVGMLLGSLCSAWFSKKCSLTVCIRSGILITIAGVVLMIGLLLHYSIIISLFLPAIIINFGLCFILANVSSIAMSQVTDKAHGSAVMNFINMGFTTIIVLGVGYFAIQRFLLPAIYFLMCVLMLIVYQAMNNRTRK